MLKPRVGYGFTGNSNIGSNAFSIYSTGIAANNFYQNYVFGTRENVGVYWQQIENENLTWETVKDLNIGLDFSFFNNRIDGSVEYYNKTIDDLLSFRPLPTDFPVSTVADNVGKTRTRGWEISLNTTNISSESGSGFSWNSNFTVSHYSSTWVERSPSNLAALEPYVDPDGPFDAVYGYKVEGLYKGKKEPPSWMPGIQPGTIIVKDINGYDNKGNLTGEADGKISEADQTLIGESDPKLSFGINNTFYYKQFDLTVNAYGLIQEKYNSDLSRSYGVENQLGTNGANILEEAAKNRWSYNNQDANYPSGISSRYDEYGNSSFWFVNANFIRIAKIALGYRMPSSILSKQNVISNAQISISVENPFVFTNYSGSDPELNSFMSYPKTRGVLFGLNITF